MKRFLFDYKMKLKIAILVPTAISIVVGAYRYISAISGLKQAMVSQMVKDAYSGNQAIAVANGGMEFYERAYQNALFNELIYSILIVAGGLALSFFMWYHASVNHQLKLRQNV